MKNNIICKKNVCFFFYTIITTFLIAMGHSFCDINRFATSAAMVIVAVALYFCIVFSVAKKNWLDIRAVFHAVWVFTVGLAALRLTDYQEEWQAKTWYCFALAYLMFQVGSHLGISLGKTFYEKTEIITKNFKLGKIKFELKENRYFIICVITTLIGLACFSINVAIRGYIPCFSPDPAAYITFYTKFHVFAVAATGVSGLCYYSIVTQKLSKFKKVILLICILYSTFIFPILVVSRGTFIVSALSLTVTVFYLHKKKFWILVTCLALIFGIYFGVSTLRNYTDNQLALLFEPSDIHISRPSTNNSQNYDDTQWNGGLSFDANLSSDISFTLPPKVAFIYSYLTVSHDNFNETVQNSTEYTYGLRQIIPFNSVLRSDWIDKQLSDAEYYLVRPHLNTVNLIGYFYYDFHTFGVVIFMLLWSFIIGVLQKFAELDKRPFYLLTLGNAMVPVALSFFAPWFSVFSQWLLWGVVLIFAVASSIKINSRKNN